MEPFTHNGRQYIVFPMPLVAEKRNTNWKDSPVIKATVGPLHPGKPEYELSRILVDTGSAMGILYLTTLNKMGLTKDDPMTW